MIQSFSFVVGDLVAAPTIRPNRDGHPPEGLLRLRNGDLRIQVKVSGPARVATVKDWAAGDKVMILGHLESYYARQCHRHILVLRGVTVVKVESDVDAAGWWESAGLPMVLAGVYRQLSGKDTQREL